MEEIPSWEANRFSANQEIPRNLWNPKLHYRFYQCPPPVPNLSQISPVHAPQSHFLKIHFNIILQSRPGFAEWTLSFRFPHQNPVCTPSHPHTCYIPRPLHSSRFDHPKNIGWGVQIIKLSLRSFLHSPVTSSLLGPNILLSALFLNTRIIPSPLSVSDKVSHPYKTKGKNYSFIYLNHYIFG